MLRKEGKIRMKLMVRSERVLNNDICSIYYLSYLFLIFTAIWSIQIYI